MSRFKELNRIEAAIQQRNREELEWALAYAGTRLEYARLKHHQKHWQKILQRIERAMGKQ